MIAYCMRCYKEIDVGPGSRNYKLVQGWVGLRARGANEVALRKDLNLFIVGVIAGVIEANGHEAPEVVAGTRSAMIAWMVG